MNTQATQIKKIFKGFTADQWELYTTDWETDQRVEGIDQVAESMNQIVNEELQNSAHENSCDMQEAIEKRFMEFSEHGAFDTEPCEKVAEVIAAWCKRTGWSRC